MDSSIKKGLMGFLPIAPSALFFGMIYGYIAASGGVSLLITSALSMFVFAGAAQVIAVVFMSQNQPMIGIIIAVTVVNLRHLIYGATLHDAFDMKWWKKLPLAFLMTDEVFLLTSLARKEKKVYDLKLVLLASGLALWVSFNIATVVGYLIQTLSNQINIPEDLLIAASFVGFLAEQWRKYREERLMISVLAILSLILFRLTTTTNLLLIIMGAGFLYTYIRDSRFMANSDTAIEVDL